MNGVMKCDSPIAFGFTECSGRRQALPAGVSSSTENALVPCSCRLLWPIINSRVCEYIDRLCLVRLLLFTSSLRATTARTLPRNNTHHHRQPAYPDPDIQAQPRASSRSRPASAACPARRAALSQTPVVVVVVVVAIAIPTPRAAASPKVRSLTLSRPALPFIPPLGTHTARVLEVPCSSLARLPSTGPSLLHTRTTRSRSNLRLACNSRITCSSIASLAFDLRLLRRCDHTNSPAVRAPATPSDVG